MKLGKNRGFSLLELMITLAIGLTMAGVTVLALMPLFKQNHVDAAYDTTLSVIRTYRSQAITQSKRYIHYVHGSGNHRQCSTGEWAFRFHRRR